MKKFLLLVALFFVTITTFAHVTEIRVNQAQDGTLTWYLQTYHGVNECGHSNAGLTINGVNYPIDAEFSGSIVGLSPTIFAQAPQISLGRSSYATVHTPFLGTTLNVAPYSNNACWAFLVGGSGNFTPPPPPVCTSCPITGWSSVMASSGNNNGTPCDLSDDITTAKIKVNHLSCASITGTGKFSVIYDFGGTNVSYGPYDYAAGGIETDVTINVPSGASSTTQVQVVDYSYPCNVTHGLTIPGGQYKGEKENVPPVINCVADMSVGMDAGNCSAVVNYALPTFSDNCGVATIQQTAGLPSGSVFPKGITTNTFVVTDPSGNTATCSFTVTVSDDLAPTAVCKNISVPLNSDLTASITVADVNNNSYDNCGPVTVVISSGKTQFDCNDIGKSFPVTILVTDQQGLTSSCTAQVTVTDPNSYCNQPPVAVCKAITLSADGNCQATALATDFDNGSSDPNGDAITFSVFPTGPYNFGTTHVTLTVTDSKGASSTCETTVTVIDDTKPTITAPAAISANNDAGKCGAVVALGTPTTGDNCGVASTTNDAPATFPVGTTTVTWTVTDIHGNSSSATQLVTVTDNEKPKITAPAAISVNNDAGKCSAVVSLGSATTSDNCAIAAPATNDAPAIFPVGTTIVTWSVADTHGNTNTATQTVIVTDNEKPVITCAGNQIFCANTGGNLNYTIPALQQGDNCGISTTTYAVSGATTRSGSGTNASGVFNIGVSTVTYTVTDIHNNVSTCSFTVTINPLPVASITASVADDFCNKLTLTGNSTLSGPFGYQWSYSSSNFQSTKQISLGLTNGDGVYSLITTDGNGCKSEFAATYDYKKQNLSSSYTIIGYEEVELGSSNVATGSVGVTSVSGKAEFKKNGSVAGPGSFVKAKTIDKDGSNIVISNPIYAAATGIALPTMLYNTASTSSLSSVTVNQNAISTLTGNYKNVTIKKGAKVTLSGTIFGTIRVEQGARVKFTAATINVEKLQVVKGPRVGYSYVQFSQNTNVLVNGSVSIGSQVYVNPEGYKVTFYVGKKTSNGKDDDSENQFMVKGGDTKVTANVFMPKGEMHVTGGYSYGDYGNGKGDSDKDDDDEKCAGLGNSFVNMTGLFIAQEVETEGKNVIWNSFDCSAPPAAAVTSLSAVTQNVGVEKTTPSVEEELKITVMPNPSTNYFTLKLESRYETPVNIVVMDVSGRVIEAKSKIASNSTIQIGQSYISGKYYAEIIQGTTHKTVQLMKVK